MSREKKFYKYSATGNDFILFESDGSLNFSRDEVAQICNRKTGIGSDGLLIFNPTILNYDFEMIFYNPDGSDAEMCGNGARAMIHFASSHFNRDGDFKFLVRSKEYQGRKSDNCSVNMGVVTKSDISFTDLLSGSEDGVVVNSGVPHAVILSDFFDMPDFVERARVIRHDARFKEGTNVDLVCFDTFKHTIEARVFERGVEGETDSSGTGATACAYAASLIYNFPKNWSVDVKMKGGVLNVSEDDSGDIWLSGSVTQSFQGSISI